MSSPIGLHRVLDPRGVLPQAAWRLDTDPAVRPDEVRISVERLNLDAASFRQLTEAHGGPSAPGVGDRVKAEVLRIIAERGKMQNPVTGSGGMLIGTVAEVGPRSPLGLTVGDRVATLVSLTLTPLAVSDALADWDGRSEQVPCSGHAILFGRSVAAVLPADLPAGLALAALDVCGAPALVSKEVSSENLRRAGTGAGPVPVVVLGAAGKSGSLSLAAARTAGAGRIVALVRDESEAAALAAAGAVTQLGLEVVIADATDPVAVADAVGEPAGITVVCVDAPGCEHGAILATAAGGTVIFFSMATSFSAAALGAEGLAADVTMLVGNGFLPGHAEHALGLLRGTPSVRLLFERRLAGH